MLTVTPDDAVCCHLCCTCFHTACIRACRLEGNEGPFSAFSAPHAALGLGLTAASTFRACHFPEHPLSARVHVHSCANDGLRYDCCPRTAAGRKLLAEATGEKRLVLHLS